VRRKIGEGSLKFNQSVNNHVKLRKLEMDQMWKLLESRYLNGLKITGEIGKGNPYRMVIEYQK
jgi:hypothetical protein